MTHTRLTIACIAALGLALSSCTEDDPFATDAADMSDMDMEDDGHDHDHDDAASAIPWDGDTTPTVEVEVSGDADAGWDVSAIVTGFSFSDPSTIEHQPGFGHSHVFVDGQLVSMSYEPVVHIATLSPGPHDATVTLSRNDHTDYSLHGALITASTTFTVAGDVAEADITVSVTFEDGVASGVDERVQASLGDVIEITVDSDVADTIHVHGYDRLFPVDSGGTATVRFDALIGGVFEIEMEESGTLLLELEVS